jgi:hypothetical protein
MVVLAEDVLAEDLLVEALFVEALLPEVFELVEKSAFKLLIPFKIIEQDLIQLFYIFVIFIFVILRTLVVKKKDYLEKGTKD